MELPLEEFYYGHPAPQTQPLEGFAPMPYSSEPPPPQPPMMQYSMDAQPMMQYSGDMPPTPSQALVPAGYFPQEVAFLEAMPLNGNSADAARWVALWNEAKAQESAKMRDQYLLTQSGISGPALGQDWGAIMMELRAVDDDVARQSTQLNAIYEANRQDPEAYAICSGIANSLLRWRIINSSIVAAQRASRELIAQSETFKPFLPIYDTAVLAMNGPIRTALQPSHGISPAALLVGSFVGGLFPSLIEAAVAQYKPQKKMSPAKSLQVINAFDRFRPMPLH